MAMQVIDRTAEVARFKALAGEDLGRGVEQAGYIFAQGLEQYNRQLEQQKTRELSVMSALGTKYGFNKMGPDFLQRFETLAGIKLPRNNKGEIELPQTDEEAMTAKLKPVVDQVINQGGPAVRDMAMAHFGLASMPKPQAEMDLMQTKLDETTRHNKAIEGLEAVKAKAALIKASMGARGPGGSARAQVLNMGSGMMENPDDPKGTSVPWDGKSKELTNNEFYNRNKATTQSQAADRISMTHVMNTMKQDADKAKTLSTLAGIIKKPGNMDAAQVEKAKAIFDTHLRLDFDEDPDEIRKRPGSWDKLLTAISSFDLSSINPTVDSANAQVDKASKQSGRKIDAFSDDQLKQRFQMYVGKGMKPEDILADPEINNDPRAKAILQAITNGK